MKNFNSKIFSDSARVKIFSFDKAEWRAENWNPEKPEVNPEYEEDAYQFIENVKSTFTTMGFLVGVTLTPAVGAFADWLKATIKSKYGTRHLGVRSSLFIGTFLLMKI